jgi:hypothetical protein
MESHDAVAAVLGAVTTMTAITYMVVMCAFCQKIRGKGTRGTAATNDNVGATKSPIKLNRTFLTNFILHSRPHHSPSPLPIVFMYVLSPDIPSNEFYPTTNTLSDRC